VTIDKKREEGRKEEVLRNIVWGSLLLFGIQVPYIIEIVIKGKENEE